MGPSLLTRSVLLVYALFHEADSQNHVEDPKGQARKHTFLINEVNADNPGEDALEYLELYHSSGQQTPLDGYFVVFYNGNGNTAYYVKNLGGLSTDDQGFLLLGSSGVVPTPRVILAKNTIQNGPDAIALYFGRTDLYPGVAVTNTSLVDALVHKSKASDQAEELVRVLTPGVEPFLEDPLFRSTDESLERCPGLDSRRVFQVGTPTPGGDNHCIPLAQLNASFVLLNEVNPEFVELQGLPSTEVKDLVLAWINGSTQEIYFVMDVRGKTSPDGLLLLGSGHDGLPVDLAVPPSAASPFFRASHGAVALYRGNASSLSVGDTASTANLLDALVYTVGERSASTLPDVWTRGKLPFPVEAGWLYNDSSISRCVCCGLTRDPSAFVLDQRTPRRFNDCPRERFSQDISLCFQDADCQKEIPEESEILMFLSLALEKQCNCGVAPAYFKDSAVGCQDGELAFTARLTARSAAQLRSLRQALSAVLQVQEAARFGKWNGTVAKTCSRDAHGTEIPSGITSEEPRTIRTTPAAPLELLINEVNPDNPGSREDTEYIELFYPGPAPFDLQDYWLVLYNGKNNLAYQVVNLGGHRTDGRGYFLVGNSGVAPKPSVVLPDNTLQNGADAVALYRSPKPIYRVNMPVTAKGLVDAVVYTARESDRADKLLAILTPGQSILYENDSHSTEDESLSRCHGLKLRDHGSFQVTRITPFRDNACPAAAPVATGETPPHNHSVVVNEVAVVDSPALYQFVELRGPPGVRLKGYSLMFVSGHDPEPHASLQLQGTFGSDGLFVVLPEGQSNEGHDHEQLVKPSLWSDPSSPQKSHGVILCRHSQVQNGTLAPDKIVEDVVVFSWETGTSQGQPALPGPIYLIRGKGERPLSISRCSCDETFAVSDPTPGSENRCPQQSRHLVLGMCLQTPNCSLWPRSPPVLASLQHALARAMEESCACGISPCYVQELNFTCVGSILKLSGQVWTRSPEQLELLAQWQANFSASPNPFPVDGRLLKVNAACPSPNRAESRSEVQSFQTWEVALIVVGSISIALLLGAAAVYYIKRRPQNYTTIEMNDRRQIMGGI